MDFVGRGMQMIIAIFGDVHGNLPAMYDLCKDWEQQMHQQIDQAGCQKKLKNQLLRK